MAEDAKEPTEDEQPDSGPVGQEDIDAPLNQAAAADADDAPVEQTAPDAEAPSAEQAAPEPAAEAPSEPEPESESAGAPTAEAGEDASGGVSQSDIDALLQASGSTEDAPPAAESGPAAEAAEPAEGGEADGLISQGALDALISEAQSTAGEINQATGATDAAAPAPPPPGAEPLALDTLGEEASGESVATVDLLRDVSMRVKIELGRTRMYVEDVLRLGKGSVVELDKLAGDPVDVFVNERLVAHGEVLVLNDNFCVRINEVCVAQAGGQNSS